MPNAHANIFQEPPPLSKMSLQWTRISFEVMTGLAVWLELTTIWGTAVNFSLCTCQLSRRRQHPQQQRRQMKKKRCNIRASENPRSAFRSISPQSPARPSSPSSFGHDPWPQRARVRFLARVCFRAFLEPKTAPYWQWKVTKMTTWIKKCWNNEHTRDRIRNYVNVMLLGIKIWDIHGRLV